MSKPLHLFVSCEHASNRVPKPYRHLFAGQEAILETHRGYDIGILDFAETLAAEFQAPMISSDVTRLLVDLNRPLGSKSLFSEFSRRLPYTERQELIRLYHQPYWRAAEDVVARMISSRCRVLHLSVHSFTPVFDGHVRNADIGLLYDPRRAAEKSWCLRWQQHLAEHQPVLRIRRNYPYRGNAAALVTALRKRYTADDYLGLELEINQQVPAQDRESWYQIQKNLKASLEECQRIHALSK